MRDDPGVANLIEQDKDKSEDNKENKEELERLSRYPNRNRKKAASAYKPALKGKKYDQEEGKIHLNFECYKPAPMTEAEKIQYVQRVIMIEEYNLTA